MTVSTRLTRTQVAVLAVLTSLALVGNAATARAQGCAQLCRETNVVSVRVPTVLRLSLDGSPLVVARHDQPGPTDAGPTAIVKSNGRWRLQVGAGSETWTPADADARTDKPVEDLLWSTSGAGGYASLSTMPSVAATGSSTAGTPIRFFFQTRFEGAADTTGTYTMVVRYTLTSS